MFYAGMAIVFAMIGYNYLKDYLAFERYLHENNNVVYLQAQEPLELSNLPKHRVSKGSSNVIDFTQYKSKRNA